MDYMGRLRETVSEKQPSHQPTKPTEPGFVGFAGSPSGPFPFPDDIQTGVDRLKVMRPPRSLPRDLWGVFVADAVWLVDYGVAADAISQGWTPLDLFGVSADEEWQSLAAWIGGRRDEFNRACILLQEIRGDRTLLYAAQALTSQRRWHYPDPAPPDARLAWIM